jgi:hypothetical protein
MPLYQSCAISLWTAASHSESSVPQTNCERWTIVQKATPSHNADGDPESPSPAHSYSNKPSTSPALAVQAPLTHEDIQWYQYCGEHGENERYKELMVRAQLEWTGEEPQVMTSIV